MDIILLIMNPFTCVRNFEALGFRNAVFFTFLCNYPDISKVFLCCSFGEMCVTVLQKI
jgi:hypothetical protein